MLNAVLYWLWFIRQNDVVKWSFEGTWQGLAIWCVVFFLFVVVLVFGFAVETCFCNTVVNSSAMIRYEPLTLLLGSVRKQNLNRTKVYS